METSKLFPLDPTLIPEDLERRLWIGNLDSRLTEYHLVKLLRTIGKVETLDFPFYRLGYLKGQPKGYCFVQFENRTQAETCVAKLDGSILLSKTIDVQWAHNAPAARMEEKIKPKQSSNLPEKLNAEKIRKIKINDKIRAIEKKLKSMEKGEDLEECVFESVRNKINPIIPLEEFKVQPKSRRWRVNKRYYNAKNVRDNKPGRRTTVSVYR